MPSSDDELLSRVRIRARENSFWAHLVVEVVEVTAGRVVVRVPVRDELRNAPGAPLHGGVLSSLVDIAVGGALSTLHDEAGGGVGQVTTDLNISFLGAVRGGAVTAEGRIVHKGRTVAFGEAELRDDDGRIVALGRATYLIVAGRR